MHRDDSFASDDWDLTRRLEKSYEQEPRRPLPRIAVGHTGFIYDSKTDTDGTTLHAFCCRACGRKSVWLRDLDEVVRHAGIHASPLNCEGRR